MGRFIGAPVREPFFKRNMIGLAVIGSIPLAVYAYTWYKLNQDDFSDIPIPPISDEELSKLKEEYKKN